MYKRILVKPERISRHVLYQKPFKPASVKSFDKKTIEIISDITGLKEWEIHHEAIELFLHNYCFNYPDNYETKNLLIEFEKREKLNAVSKQEPA